MPLCKVRTSFFSAHTFGGGGCWSGGERTPEGVRQIKCIPTSANVSRTGQKSKKMSVMSMGSLDTDALNKALSTCVPWLEQCRLSYRANGDKSGFLAMVRRHGATQPLGSQSYQTILKALLRHFRTEGKLDIYRAAGAMYEPPEMLSDESLLELLEDNGLTATASREHNLDTYMEWWLVNGWEALVELGANYIEEGSVESLPINDEENREEGEGSESTDMTPVNSSVNEEEIPLVGDNSPPFAHASPSIDDQEREGRWEAVEPDPTLYVGGQEKMYYREYYPFKVEGASPIDLPQICKNAVGRYVLLIKPADAQETGWAGIPPEGSAATMVLALVVSVDQNARPYRSISDAMEFATLPKMPRMVAVELHHPFREHLVSNHETFFQEVGDSQMIVQFVTKNDFFEMYEQQGYNCFPIEEENLLPGGINDWFFANGPSCDVDVPSTWNCENFYLRNGESCFKKVTAQHKQVRQEVMGQTTHSLDRLGGALQERGLIDDERRIRAAQLLSMAHQQAINNTQEPISMKVNPDLCGPLRSVKTGEALPPGTSYHARLSESREATKNEPMDACSIQAKYRWICGTCPANQAALAECFETDSKGALSIQFNDINLAKLTTLDTDTWFCDMCPSQGGRALAFPPFDLFMSCPRDSCNKYFITSKDKFTRACPACNLRFGEPLSDRIILKGEGGNTSLDELDIRQRSCPLQYVRASGKGGSVWDLPGCYTNTVPEVVARLNTIRSDPLEAGDYMVPVELTERVVTLLPYFKYEIGGVNALTLEDFMSRDRSPLARIATTRLTKLTKYCDIPMPKKPSYYSSLSDAMKVEDLIIASYNAVKMQCDLGGSQYQQDPESHKKVLEMTFLHPSRGQRQHPETVYVLLMLHLKDYSVRIADKCRHPASSQLYFNEKIAGGIIRPIYVAENHQNTLFFATPLEAELISAASLNVARKLMTSSDPKTPAKPAIPMKKTLEKTPVKFAKPSPKTKDPKSSGQEKQEELNTERICFYFQKSDGCRFGEKCQFPHICGYQQHPGGEICGQSHPASDHKKYSQEKSSGKKHESQKSVGFHPEPKSGGRITMQHNKVTPPFYEDLGYANWSDYVKAQGTNDDDSSEDSFDTETWCQVSSGRGSTGKNNHDYTPPAKAPKGQVNYKSTLPIAEPVIYKWSSKLDLKLKNTVMETKGAIKQYCNKTQHQKCKELVILLERLFEHSNIRTTRLGSPPNQKTTVWWERPPIRQLGMQPPEKMVCMYFQSKEGCNKMPGCCPFLHVWAPKHPGGIFGSRSHPISLRKGSLLQPELSFTRTYTINIDKKISVHSLARESVKNTVFIFLEIWRKFWSRSRSQSDAVSSWVDSMWAAKENTSLEQASAFASLRQRHRESLLQPPPMPKSREPKSSGQEKQDALKQVRYCYPFQKEDGCDKERCQFLHVCSFRGHKNSEICGKRHSESDHRKANRFKKMEGRKSTGKRELITVLTEDETDPLYHHPVGTQAQVAAHETHSLLLYFRSVIYMLVKEFKNPNSLAILNATSNRWLANKVSWMLLCCMDENGDNWEGHEVAAKWWLTHDGTCKNQTWQALVFLDESNDMNWEKAAPLELLPLQAALQGACSRKVTRNMTRDLALIARISPLVNFLVQWKENKLWTTSSEMIHTWRTNMDHWNLLLEKHHIELKIKALIAVQVIDSEESKLQDAHPGAPFGNAVEANPEQLWNFLVPPFLAVHAFYSPPFGIDLPARQKSDRHPLGGMDLVWNTSTSVHILQLPSDIQTVIAAHLNLEDLALLVMKNTSEDWRAPYIVAHSGNYY